MLGKSFLFSFIFNKITLFMLFVVALQIVNVDFAFASGNLSSGAFTPLQQVVEMIVDFITGPFGRLIAIISVIGLGFMTFAGRLSWFTAGAVILGIGLVFGARTIVEQIITNVK